MMRYCLFMIVLLFCMPDSFGQYKPKKNKKQFYGNPRLHKPLYRWVTGDYTKHGIQLSFGPTYTFTPLKSREEELKITSGTPNFDTTLNYNIDTKSRLGLFAEIGMVHITKRPRKIIQYFDWGIGFKIFNGAELAHTNVYDYRDSLAASLDGKGEFSNGYLYGRFAAHNVFQINEHLFLDNALGFNVDYLIKPGNKEYSGYRSPVEQKFQGDLTVQLNYALGLGFKPNINKGFFIIPTVEVPFLGVHEWNGGTPQIHWFSSKYYPAMLKVRLIWLFRKDPLRCPPVETNDDDRQRAREYEGR